MPNLPPQFHELVRVQLDPTLHLVFSRREDGLISVAQQRWVRTITGAKQGMWIKNALITDEHGIEEALNGFQACLDILLELKERAKLDAEESDPTPINGLQKARMLG